MRHGAADAARPDRAGRVPRRRGPRGADRAEHRARRRLRDRARERGGRRAGAAGGARPRWPGCRATPSPRRRRAPSTRCCTCGVRVRTGPAVRRRGRCGAAVRDRRRSRWSTPCGPIPGGTCVAVRAGRRSRSGSGSRVADDRRRRARRRRGGPRARRCGCRAALGARGTAACRSSRASRPGARRVPSCPAVLSVAAAQLRAGAPARGRVGAGRSGRPVGRRARRSTSCVGRRPARRRARDAARSGPPRSSRRPGCRDDLGAPLADVLDGSASAWRPTRSARASGAPRSPGRGRPRRCSRGCRCSAWCSARRSGPNPVGGGARRRDRTAAAVVGVVLVVLGRWWTAALLRSRRADDDAPRGRRRRPVPARVTGVLVALAVLGATSPWWVRRPVRRAPADAVTRRSPRRRRRTPCCCSTWWRWRSRPGRRSRARCAAVGSAVGGRPATGSRGRRRRCCSGRRGGRRGPGRPSALADVADVARGQLDHGSAPGPALRARADQLRRRAEREHGPRPGPWACGSCCRSGCASCRPSSCSASCRWCSASPRACSVRTA